MLITNDFEVAEPVGAVWEFFGDIPRVASCLPGAELTTDLGNDSYAGNVAIRNGVSGLLATTDTTVKEVSVGAVRYAGSVARLLG